MSSQDEQHENGPYTIAPRRVSFDREKTPLHRIPDEPSATHVIDVPHPLLPAGEGLGAAVPRSLRPSYHPSQEGSPRRAVEYLAKSPAVRTAAGASARAASA